MADQPPKCEECGGQTEYTGTTGDMMVYKCPSCNTNRRYIVYIEKPAFQKERWVDHNKRGR